MTVVPSSPILACGALREISPSNSPASGALPEAGTAFALPNSPAFTRQHRRYLPALTADTSQRKVALRPAASGLSGYVSTNADERSSGAGSSGGFTRSVAVGILLTTNWGRSVSAALVSAVVVLKEPPSPGPHLTVTEIVGIVFWPAFWTTISIVESLARLWSAGNDALTTFTGKLPVGSFTSCFSLLPPQPATTSAQAPASAAILRCAVDPPKVRAAYTGRQRTRASCLQAVKHRLLRRFQLVPRADDAVRFRRAGGTSRTRTRDPGRRPTWFAL